LKNIVTRTFTGLTFATLVTIAIGFHAYTFLALFTLITGLGLWEFYNCARLEGRHRWADIAGGMYLFAATFFYASGTVSGCVYLPYLLFILTLFVRGLYRKTPQPVHDQALALFAQVYCAGLFSLLNFIVFDGGTYMPVYPLIIFAFVWLNDTGAYLIGSQWGKRRLFPRISPYKSWEGFWGGLAVTLTAALLFAGFGPQILPAWFHWPALALIVVTFGTWGDLVESQIKRTYNLKDSGSLLPGHGGILDRADSVMLAAPAVCFYLKCFIQS
jgi:phosphatidate cytidylyltransferase